MYSHSRQAYLGEYSSPFCQWDGAFQQAYENDDWTQVKAIADKEVSNPQSLLNILRPGTDRDIYSIELHHAIRTNDVARARKLVDKHANPDDYKSIRRYHIFIAAMLPDTAMLSMLLEFDNEYHTRANHLMLCAAENKNLPLLKFALANGANCNEWRGKLFNDYMGLFYARPWLETILKAGFFRNPDNLSTAGQVFEAIYHVYRDCVEELPDGDYLNDIDVTNMIFAPILSRAGKTPMDVLGDLPPHLTNHCLRLLGRP